MPVLFLFCRSAQFEHTILITKTGFEVLTAGKNENFDKKELHIAGSDDIVKETSSSSESTWTFKWSQIPLWSNSYSKSQSVAQECEVYH